MAYIGTSPSNGVRRIHTYTATSGQTTFTGSSTEGVTLSYADTNYIDVFQNGVLLGSADYTSTSGTSVVLAQGASVSDLVVIVVYDVFSVADTVSKTNGGTFDGNVTVSGDTTLNGKFLIDGSNNDLMTFRTTGDTASQVLGLQFQNNSEAVTAQIFGTGDNSSSGVFRIKGIGSVELHGGDVAVSGDATNMLKIDANGHVTMPNQPAFLIKASGGQQNIAINTMTEVQWNGTEVFDQNLDFASHTFTAPVTGKYQFNAHMYLNSLDTAASYYQVQITTSNRSYPEVFTPNFSSDPTYWSFTLNMLTDMDASDTATISVYQSGGTAQLDVDGGSYFSGYLVC